MQQRRGNRIGLIDMDLALMKISKYYKDLDEKVYASCLFTWNRDKCLELQDKFGDKIEIGGTGWDFKEINRQLVQVNCSELPKEIENYKADFDLYKADDIYKRISRGIGKKENKIKKAQTIANMGIGFTSRGCVRKCGFCVVSKKEGILKKESEIIDIINPKSNIITLLDNNLTADPECIDKLKEIKERKLIIDITQGIDVRIMTEEKAQTLREVKLLRSLHYAWDLME